MCLNKKAQNIDIFETNTAFKYHRLQVLEVKGLLTKFIVRLGVLDFGWLALCTTGFSVIVLSHITEKNGLLPFQFE